jgi:hypothetical protein
VKDIEVSQFVPVRDFHHDPIFGNTSEDLLYERSLTITDIKARAAPSAGRNSMPLPEG